MVSTSSSSFSTPLWNHDVYLSFRGEDSRKTFVDHLYTALQQRGILTYIDNETLPHGAPIDLTLLKAIQESRIAVVVFSKNHGYSQWCLDELANIMKCKNERGQIVMPIFYHVDPSHVQKQEGSYGEAFSRHELENNIKVESWRKALLTASNLPGWKLNNNLDSRESRCIKEVVDTIWNKLFPSEELAEIGTPLQDLKLRDGDNYSKPTIKSMVSNSLLSSRPLYYTPTSSKLWNHDVFVSFRGEDTRNNFVDHLYSALDQREILTYKEEETLPLGESINSSYLKAIEESRMSVIVFSKNYAASSHCLDELAYILKCMNDRGQIVIPVFYDVDPWEVKEQKGYYEEAFVVHESSDCNKAEYWRKALAGACKLFGWRIRGIADGYESKAIKLIADTILKRLFPNKALIGPHTRLEGLKHGADNGMATLVYSHDDVEDLRIPLRDIILATNQFSKRNIIARGGFGTVYQGQSQQHGTVAVKQLDRSNGQGDREFMMEIALLSTYKHANIVSLIGFCDQGDEKILVYKYESNGSLDKHLHSKDLTWIQRLQLCLDAANGLKYLHEDVGSQHRILHRDIKSSNILLDENWKAKISDFGLSKITLANVPFSVIISGACGTMGYVDPQYQEHNILTQKSDVYSFGIVLFEVLCGRLVNVRQYQDKHNFSAKLAQNHYEKGTLEEIIDSDLWSQMDSDSLSTFSNIAYQCLKERREERPTMSLVVDQVEKALEYQQGLSGFWHDVYISFRVRDTECHIVDDIRTALHQEGISTYKDNVTHLRKESILLKAIERSKIFIIIFTRKFAINSWYLDEVVKITECVKDKGKFVLPVFYNVSQPDVRAQKGYFGEVMSEYDTHPRIEVWRNALVEATNAPGLEYSKFWCSADLVKKVVEEITSALSAKVK